MSFDSPDSVTTELLATQEQRIEQLRRVERARVALGRELEALHDIDAYIARLHIERLYLRHVGRSIHQKGPSQS